MDILSFILGIVIGVIAVAIAIELGMKRTDKSQPTSRPTHKWTLDEIQNPRVIAEYIGDVNLPTNARVVVNQFQNKDILKGKMVKSHSGIRGNFVVGDDRALIFAGPFTDQELGIWTVDRSMIEKLDRYFEESWSKGHTLSFDEDAKLKPKAGS